MQPNKIQPQNQVQDPTKGANEARASMGIATRLNEALLQHKAPQKPTEKPQDDPGQEKEHKGDNPTEEKKEPNLNEELTKFKTEIEGMMDSKFGDLKREIETALNDEPDEQTN